MLIQTRNAQVKHMMERPGDASGMELLKKTLDISMGLGGAGDAANDPSARVHEQVCPPRCASVGSCALIRCAKLTHRWPLFCPRS
eukprot:SAG11_NODE_20397_length_446_cov_0.870317_2_plen_84_part_01